MDAVDPALSQKMEQAARAVPGVVDVYDVSVRWIGHRLRGELRVGVDDKSTLAQGHKISEEVQHELMHAVPELVDVTIHMDPLRDGSGSAYHELTAHHYPASGPAAASGGNGSLQPAIPAAPANEYANILRPTEGIQIIDDITTQFGVHTLEGRIGPLLRGVGSRAQYIEMPPGMYLYEHPHPTEAIIYTVRGRWVSCTDGKRHVMNPGSLFWFGPDIAAGYEVPFDEPAFILIFKGERGIEPAAFVDYLENKLKPSLVQEQLDGASFLVAGLPPDHPARKFADELTAVKT
jgi:quercetin dioxygenase-like cupin family protein